MMKITVFGTGYVGTVTGTCFADLGNNVLCMDVDAKKIERLYKMKGYAFVQVTRDVAETPSGRTVTFTVLEGPKVEVDSITFKGNEHLAKGKLTDDKGEEAEGKAQSSLGKAESAVDDAIDSAKAKAEDIKR